MCALEIFDIRNPPSVIRRQQIGPCQIGMGNPVIWLQLDGMFQQVDRTLGWPAPERQRVADTLPYPKVSATGGEAREGPRR